MEIITDEIGSISHGRGSIVGLGNRNRSHGRAINFRSPFRILSETNVVDETEEDRVSTNRSSKGSDLITRLGREKLREI